MINNFDVVGVYLSETFLDEEKFEPCQFLDVKVRINYWAQPPARGGNLTQCEIADQIADAIREKLKTINHNWNGLDKLPVHFYLEAK